MGTEVKEYWVRACVGLCIRLRYRINGGLSYFPPVECRLWCQVRRRWVQVVERFDTGAIRAVSIVQRLFYGSLKRTTCGSNVTEAAILGVDGDAGASEVRPSQLVLGG